VVTSVYVSLSVSVCPSVRGRMPIHYYIDPDVTWRSGRRCHLVVHYWADLQSGHRLRCYGNITRTQMLASTSEYMLVLAVCLVSYKCSAVAETGVWPQ